jgi:hypothetical protein
MRQVVVSRAAIFRVAREIRSPVSNEIVLVGALRGAADDFEEDATSFDKIHKSLRLVFV